MADFAAVVPMLIVTLAGVAAMLAEAFRDPGERMPIGGLGVIGLLGAGVASVLLWGRGASSFEVIRADDFALFVNVILVMAGVLTIVFSADVVEREELPSGEYYALTLFAIAGMMLMAAAVDLLVLFLGLEVLSLSVYVLTGIRRSSVAGTEGAFKYFLLGAFSSAFFLYGIAFAFVVSGGTDIARLGQAVASQGEAGSGLVWVSLGLLLVGFGFKVAAVPFHSWAPDAYEGAPAVVTGFMSTGVKVAAFAALVRVVTTAFDAVHASWAPGVWAIAIATMVLGSTVGLAQTNLKRMLAYSSIAHAGYLLVGVVVATPMATAAVLFYLVAYVLTNLGAFGIIASLGTRDRANDSLEDVVGLGSSRPASAALLTVLLLSLGGFPPTAGFIGKWYLFSAAVQEGYVGLAIVGVLTSVVSVFYYLRVVVKMYMTPESSAPTLGSAPAGATLAAVAATVVGVLLLGILPTRLIALATESISAIF